MATISTITVTVPLPLPLGDRAVAMAVVRDGSNVVLGGYAVEWSSSNTTVARINPVTGVITTLSLGSTTIAARIGGIVGSVSVTVTAAGVVAPPPGVLDFDLSTLRLGTAAQPLVLDYDQDTLYLGMAAGDVPPPPPGGGRFLVNGTLTFGDSTLDVAQTTTATAAFVDQHGDAVAGTPVWSSSTPSLATVDASTGVVTAVASGTLDIRATVGTLVLSRTITVNGPAPVSSGAGPIRHITVEARTDSIAENGSTTQLIARPFNYSFEELVRPAITWTVLPPERATVSASGVVTMIGQGNVVVLATTEGVTGKTLIRSRGVVTTPVRVGVDLGTIAPAIHAATMTEGATGRTAVATVYNADDGVLTGHAVTWTSSNPSVVQINATTGAMTTQGPGYATITGTVTSTGGTISGTALMRVYPTVFGAYEFRRPIAALPIREDGTSMTYNATTGEIDGTVWDTPRPSNFSSSATYPLRTTWAAINADILASATVANPVIHVDKALLTSNAGVIRLPVRAAAGWLVIRPVSVAGLPAYNDNPKTCTAALNRVNFTDHAALMPTLEVPGPVQGIIELTADVGERRTYIEGFNLNAAVGFDSYSTFALARGDGGGGLVLGTAAQRAGKIIFANCLFDGMRDPLLGPVTGAEKWTGRNVLVVQMADVAFIGCGFRGSGRSGLESQGVTVNETIRFKMINCDPLAPTENVFFGWGGGAVGRAADLINSDVEIRANLFRKLPEWYGTTPAKLYMIQKNLFEIKSGRRFVFEGNDCSDTWNEWGGASQIGQIVQLAQTTDVDNSHIADVTIMHNYGRRIGGTMLGLNNFLSAGGVYDTPDDTPVRRIECSYNYVDMAAVPGGELFVVQYVGVASADFEDINILHTTITCDDAPARTRAESNARGSWYSKMFNVGDITGGTHFKRLRFDDNVWRRAYSPFLAPGTSNPSTIWPLITVGGEASLSKNAFYGEDAGLLGPPGFPLPADETSEFLTTTVAKVNTDGTLQPDSPLKAGGAFDPSSTEDKGADFAVAPFTRILAGALR